MKDARWELTAKLGKDIDTWSWGRLHRLFLKNQTLGTEGPGFLQYMLNRGPWKLGGGEAAVNATGWNAAGGYGVVWVPSMRMVVNLGGPRQVQVDQPHRRLAGTPTARTTPTRRTSGPRANCCPGPSPRRRSAASTSDTLVLKP